MDILRARERLVSWLCYMTVVTYLTLVRVEVLFYLVAVALIGGLLWLAGDRGLALCSWLGGTAPLIVILARRGWSRWTAR